ncbi:DivIVA domain-containing protein [Arthrobacter sp. Edens01]|uniref:DivIVA domain-containing protein n=1 Tax=Arthrobacter sp. Edens01 TaxID=1732020 RepID=UPI0009E73B17|nr:DivIVA domain-containing protein [Arthrobacter sp. Edens01]
MILLAFLAIAAVGAAALLVAGRIGPGRLRRRSGSADGGWEALSPSEPLATLGEPDPRLPPVLLPEHPGAADVGALKFSVAFRGYRMDEVDQVLERLGAALEERDAALARFRGPGPETDAGSAPRTGRHALIQPGESGTNPQPGSTRPGNIKPGTTEP